MAALQASRVRRASSIGNGKDVDEVMIVLGADTDKSSHTVAAINTATGRLLGDETVAVGARGFAALVIWARGLDGERVWALEDCRHVRARWSGW